MKRIERASACGGGGNHDLGGHRSEKSFVGWSNSEYLKPPRLTPEFPDSTRSRPERSLDQWLIHASHQLIRRQLV
jgi:hypothetical protein